MVTPLRQRAVEGFLNVFGPNAAKIRLFRAPGRVNLIGEHTDYNDGYVFPAALDREIVIAARPRKDRKVQLYSLDFGGSVEFSLDSIDRDSNERWSNYFRGVAWALAGSGYTLLGMDAAIVGDIPPGAGLSSSAAFEVASGYALLTLSGYNVDLRELALLCQRAENEFVGVKCGIMDQFASALARQGHALFLDCRSLEYQHVPLPSEDFAIAICDTGTSRELAGSKYNERRAECERALEILAARLPGAKALRDVTSKDLDELGHLLPEVIRKRAAHVVGENERTLRAVSALERGDREGFGRLMNESHESLRDLYEVSSPALDAMVESALAFEGTLGARMTGAGFGGCAVSLVRKERAGEFAHQVLEDYMRKVDGKFDHKPEIYICEPSDGVGEVES